MNNFIRYSTIAAACAAVLTIMSPTFAAGSGSYDPNDVGALGNPAVFNRVITITPETKWVNVDNRETVKFVNSKTGQSFVWNFRTGGDAHFDFSKIAPAGILFGAPVTAYVAELPLPDREN